MSRAVGLHIAVLAGLALAQFTLPEYHHGNLARIMVLAAFASAYNITFGYAGMLSLGHAMFFGAGLYAAGLAAEFGGIAAPGGLVLGVIAGALMAAVVGVLALRTTGVSFMIVTLMFAQAAFLTVLYFGEWTRGDEGFVIASDMRRVLGLDLADPATRYWAAFAVFGAVMLGSLAVARSSFGRVLAAIRENEERTRMLGYDVFRAKLMALAVSGAMAGAAGAAYALLFGYVGATFASIQYSILPLLWVLTGGAATVLGPFLGTLLMFYLIDVSSSFTTAHMMIVGFALIGLILFFPKGILGTLRERVVPWLP
ncbi:branched-chain amino acid ABC transporter permease [Limibaculum sp. M0105]|uniref:Branched-chain amino acid ABC transporter permease n=1 Tax=Thermohalobaculum xanthum TaxID=2753746 RepID=A0A8J7SFL2_9RHOB|nr:branched-chain amino acid ABC transporter permease [Thermohalobaculum xanthum]MBK0399612.1 branched-chain amino acid ABC transporter permease [Thermohalobaculum xanthum]